MSFIHIKSNISSRDPELLLDQFWIVVRELTYCQFKGVSVHSFKDAVNFLPRKILQTFWLVVYKYMYHFKDKMDLLSFVYKIDKYQALESFILSKICYITYLIIIIFI